MLLDESQIIHALASCYRMWTYYHVQRRNPAYPGLQGISLPPDDEDTLARGLLPALLDALTPEPAFDTAATPGSSRLLLWCLETHLEQEADKLLPGVFAVMSGLYEELCDGPSDHGQPPIDKQRVTLDLAEWRFKNIHRSTAHDGISPPFSQEDNTRGRTGFLLNTPEILLTLVGTVHIARLFDEFEKHQAIDPDYCDDNLDPNDFICLHCFVAPDLLDALQSGTYDTDSFSKGDSMVGWAISNLLADTAWRLPASGFQALIALYERHARYRVQDWYDAVSDKADRPWLEKTHRERLAQIETTLTLWHNQQLTRQKPAHLR